MKHLLIQSFSRGNNELSFPQSYVSRWTSDLLLFSVPKVLKQHLVFVSKLHNRRGFSPVCGSGQPILFALLNVWPNFLLSYITGHCQCWTFHWPQPISPGLCAAGWSKQWLTPAACLPTLTRFIITLPSFPLLSICNCTQCSYLHVL